MAQITLQILNGLERGYIYRNIPTPLSIGREDENTIRLNDERVSRFHAKIQDDSGQVILTDLDSTNGTRVNGTPVQIRVLKAGDQIAVGKSLLLFGSPEELAARRSGLDRSTEGMGAVESGTLTLSGELPHEPTIKQDIPELEDSDVEIQEMESPFPDGPPSLPQDLRPRHAAVLYDLLTYLHHEVSQIVESGEEHAGQQMSVPWGEWQRLVQLQMNLALYQRELADPDR